MSRTVGAGRDTAPGSQARLPDHPARLVRGLGAESKDAPESMAQLAHRLVHFSDLRRASGAPRQMGWP